MSTSPIAEIVRTDARVQSGYTIPSDGWLAAAYMQPRRGFPMTYVFAVMAVMSFFMFLGFFAGEISGLTLGGMFMAWIVAFAGVLAVNGESPKVAKVIRIPIDRLRHLGRHVVMTESGIILDTPNVTRFLPWEGVRWAPPAFRDTNAEASPRDLMTTSTE
ncbi:hypothetical protein [Gordonia rhizosphera]|uniref:Uncharacterized protein n=1 Tax=Gordonia rhizosphera NBRC 16068 TaxID=1108045 RepID=K6W613_9ACTN|nr:hypothetical protein [Gordonia rhizosphera]GAB89141.1 hypothetical protein GORHZ_052_00090 [Gordonia rhizosphera NBRC 16068]